MSTTRWLLLLLVAVGIGSFVNMIMENIDINIWIARAAGCLVSAVVGLIFYKYFNRH
ncbi:hypothetical protein KFZ56_01350 [Virgibacillus sp. NKC19-3]|uniref:hypothetical protein n=1 Tax=Virgibacillus saliphilus TaxID=2831674 RepID=UPI001C9ADB83|nr:hypothetical protein [Virgibacillus sp. NKC19-3]MBY7141759.1 hypothetical protein [Virgibacillus sp. NKC19-3]